MKRLVDLVAREPALLTAALRAWLLVAVGLGLRLDPEDIAGLMLAVEATLVIVTRALSTPTSEVDAQADAKAALRETEIRGYLETVQARRAERPLRGSPGG